MTPDFSGLEWTNWMCPGCGSGDHWFKTETDCCRRRSVGAYSHLRCPFCTDLPGWTICTDGTTRPCACAAYSLRPQNPVPQPDKINGLSATVLAVVCNALFPDAFVIPRTAKATETKEK
jgi:hypothetical protein